jgi:type I restriction enzyme S subunit
MNRNNKIGDFVHSHSKGITPTYVEKSSLLILNQKCIRNNRIDYSFAQYCDSTKNLPKAKIVKKGDVLINSTGQGTAGRTAFVKEVPEDIILTVDSHVLILRFESYEIARSINYLLYQNEKLIQSFLDGSTGQGELDRVRLFNLAVDFPEDKVNQEKIVKFLELLDNKIDLNKKIIEELECLSNQLYNYWFVQFEFPNNENKPYQLSGGKMVWCDMYQGEIPEGWKTLKLSDVVTAGKNGDWGQDVNTGNYQLKVNCIRGADINGIMGLEDCNAPIRYILEKNNNKFLDAYDLIIEISGGGPNQSTGRLAYLTNETFDRFSNNLICSNFCKAISLNEIKYFYNFIHHWNFLYQNKIFFSYEGKTSGLKNLLLDSVLETCHIVLPTLDIAEKFFSIRSRYEKIKQKLLSENLELNKFRKTTTPLLMSEEIKIT